MFYLRVAKVFAFLDDLKYFNGFEFKSSVTKAEVTVVQMISRAVPEIGLYIDFGALFLLLFWRSKKVNKQWLCLSNNKV